MFRFDAGAAGVALQACVVQVSPPSGRGGPERWTGRLASGVSACFHARATSWGAALIRGLVRCSAPDRMPFTRSGNVPGAPQGGVIALEVCLRGVSSAWSRRGSGWTRGAAGVGTVWGSPMQDSMKASKESLSRLCPLCDVSLPAARWGVSSVASLVSDIARVSGGSRGGASPGALASA